MTYKLILSLIIILLLVVTLVVAYLKVTRDLSTYNEIKADLNCLYNVDNLIISNAQSIKKNEISLNNYTFANYKEFIAEIEEIDRELDSLKSQCQSVGGLVQLQEHYSKFKDLEKDFENYFDDLSRLQKSARESIKNEMDNINLKI